MRGISFRHMIKGVGKLLRDQRGNTMFLTAAAVVPIIGIVGSGVDIGRAYMAQARLQQACDAGVLAGRRAMSGSTYTTAAQSEANKMFTFNYPSDTYGSSNVTFASQAQGTTTVVGTATARLPTALMQVFSYNNFNLSVNCTAKLEISNADVMLVLDVTGSMAQTNSGDSVSRIDALKSATMDFFDTLTNAEIGDGRLRFGVVPYSSTVNVGGILVAKDPSWLSDNILLPSRTPVFRVTWGNASSQTSDDYSQGQTSYGNWSNVSTTGGQTSSSCSNLDPPSDTTPSTSGSPSSNQTAQYVDGDGNRVTTYDTNQNYTYYNYRYTWSGNRCRLQRRVATFTRTSTTTVTEEPVQTFDNKYKYEDRVFDVSAAKTGSSITTDTGDSGADRSYTWGGCIMERNTVPYASNQNTPPAAFDMDVDMVPTSDDDTKWKVLVPQIAFPRASYPSYSPSNNGNSITVNASSVTSENSSNGSWQNYSKYWGNGWGVCPAAAMKLTTLTKNDRSSFNSYINSLQPLGGTYHDSGMVWGIRLLSPDGLFADENTTAPNNRPISRHIIFMTDGEMSANMGNLSFQGYEHTMHRVGGNDDGDLTARHNNRFSQLCSRAKSKNITVWVVTFGVGLNTELTNCATADKAYTAANSTQLNEQFQAIARQISKLRLSQ